MKEKIKTLSVREFAKRSNVSRATIVYHIKKKHINTIKQRLIVLRLPETELSTLKSILKRT